MKTLSELIPGKTYHVRFDDCCVNGSFTSVFVRLTNPEDDPYCGTLWENGVTIEGHALTFIDPDQEKDAE